MWVMVRVREPTVICADPVTANSESSSIVVLVDKNLNAPDLAWPVSPTWKSLLPEPVLMVLEFWTVSDPDKLTSVAKWFHDHGSS